MKLKQLSLFLENKPGALSRPARILARANVNILTLSIAEANQFGILRLILRDWEKAKKLLEKEGFVVKVTDVVAVEVADRPGGLAEILDALEKASINVRKHGVSFEVACQVFFDPFIRVEDASADEEQRDTAIGLTEDWTLLFVIHILREGDTIRINFSTASDYAGTEVL